MPQGSVLITGASTGIGEACALHLDRLGFTVFAGVRKALDGEALRSKASNRLTPLRMDVTDGASIEAAVRMLQGRPLAGLVNNAGVNVSAPVELLPLDRLRYQLEVNVVGQVAVTQAFLPSLRAGRGRIVNMGSIGGRSTAPVQGAYGASKFALEAITDSLRMELKPWGIHVSIVEPGAIRTPIWDKGISEADRLFQSVPPDQADLYRKLIEALRNMAGRSAKGAISPDSVAFAVAHALTAARPKTRYLVGRDAKIQALLVHLPDRWRDALILKFIGM